MPTPFLARPTPCLPPLLLVLCHSAHFGVLVQGRRHAEPIHPSTESNLVFRPNPPRHDIGRRPTKDARHDATRPRIRTGAPSAPTIGATTANPTTPASASIASATDPGSAGSTGSAGPTGPTTGSTATAPTSARPSHSIHAALDYHARNANTYSCRWDP